MLADDGAKAGIEVAGVRAEGSVTDALGEGGGVGDVGEEDCGHAGRKIFPAAKKAFDSGEYRIRIAVHLRRVAIKGDETRIGYPGREELGRVQPEVLDVAPVKHERRTADLRQKLAHVQFGQDGQRCAHHLRRPALAHVASELAGGFPGGPTKNHTGRRLSEERPVLVYQTYKALGLTRRK